MVNDWQNFKKSVTALGCFASYRAKALFHTERRKSTMSDKEIIALYFARDEQALAQTDAKYGPYCFSLANAILSSREDAEEALNDTYLKAWQSMPPKKPSVLRLFLAKITRNLAFRRL